LKGVSGKNIIIMNTIYDGFLIFFLLKYSFKNCPSIGKDSTTIISITVAEENNTTETKVFNNGFQ
jgi:hypothetical protein